MVSSELELLAPAKINLVLRICGRRADGYHEIETVMQKLELADHLKIKINFDFKNVELRCPGIDLPEDENNLIYQAAQAFLDYTGISAGVQIRLDKRIPVAAGLGGGSSDAAATLLGLNDLFSTDLAEDDLLGLASALGADVPFFVGKNGAAYATGIGTTLRNIGSITDCWIILVNPGLAVSTKWAYENFRLTNTDKPYMFSGYSKSLENEFPTGMSTVLKKCGTEFPFNDLETVTVQRYGVIKNIKDELQRQGACLAMMSGSGPTVFGVFIRRTEAEASYNVFNKKYNGVFLTQPVST